VAPFRGFDQINLDTEPSPTVAAKGIWGSYNSQYWIEDDGVIFTERKQNIDKPPYRVPLMSEIVDLPWNGLKVASTFSGAGGSCTGYRMAGFKVVWANEFVPAAQASYKANAAADCFLDCRDIKLVTADDIFAATGLEQGELDLFDGSPPCQAFSTAGKREKGWGTAKKYEHGASQCNETLFSQYVRLLRGLMPKTFVAENVSGLVKGTAKGYFLEILADLKASGYRVTCKVLDAQWLGVPQMRQRTIFVGVREDLGIDPVHPKPLAYRYSVRDALPWIGKIAVNRFDYADASTVQASTVQASTVQASTGRRTSSTLAGEPLGMVEVAVGAYRDDRGAFGNGGDITDAPAPAPAVLAGSVGTHWIETAKPLPPSRKAGAYGVTEVDPNSPCATVTISSPGNDLAVPHGVERRKFTIAELKRICSFPDDFVLCGTYAQQWERLGNSVPPVMMRAIATEIRDKILLT
jgi:DNA (cytosine-5)-methyltransferase 1